MASRTGRSLFLILSTLIGLSVPLPTLSLPLFDLSPQTDAINKINPVIDSISSPFDSVTTLKTFEQACQKVPTISSIEHQALLLLSIQQAMMYLLIQEISRVKRYQAYWQEQLHHPYAYFLSKPPHKWFKGKPQKEDLLDTLKILSIIESNLAEHIGILKNNLDEYTTVRTPTDLKDTVEQQQTFLVTFFGNTPQSDFNADMVLIGNGFAQYHQMMCDLIKPYKRANHFSRNWISYTAAGLCLGAAACWYFKNPDANKAWVNEVIEKRKQEMTRFGQEYVKNPVLRVYEEVFCKPPFRDEQENRDLLRFSVQFFKKIGINLEEDVRFYPDYLALEKAIENKDPNVESMMQQVADKAAPEIEHIFIDTGYKKITVFNAKEAGILICLLIKRGFFNLRYTVNLLLPFVALIPAYAISYFSFAGIKAAYQKLTPHKTAHQGILITLLHVEELLNDNATKDMLETQDLGMLTYYLGILGEYAQDLSIQEHYDFCKDLNKLFNSSRSIAQKLKDIDIIRKKYQFWA